MTTAEQIASAYGLTLAQARKVVEIAGRLGVDGSWLAALISFPAWVTSANPGIRTPRDYVAKMVSQARLPLAEGLPEYPFVGPPLLPFEIPPMGTPKDDGWKFWFNVGGLVFFGTTLVLSAVKLSRRRV
jgi:hypothetical protein